jgi:hypothetical protein
MMFEQISVRTVINFVSQSIFKQRSGSDCGWDLVQLARPGGRKAA